MTVFIVRYGNYYPLEVDSIWSDEEEAQKRASELGGSFAVEPYDVYEIWQPDADQLPM
jgi:hypothetical protein